MTSEPPRRRRSTSELEGQRQAHELAVRLGRSLKEGRLAGRLRQHDVAADVGVSQSWVSRMERGWAAGASLETWACAAVAVGERLAAFLEHQPGASRPRDYEHLRRQQLIVDVATRGGWRAMPEQPIDADRLRSRSIDVFLERPSRREAAVTEIWDYFDDVGSSIRSFEDKLAALRRHFDVGADLARAPVAVGGLFVVRGTRRNRALVREFSSIFQARFPGSSVGWLAALTDPAAPIPNRPALIWTDVRGERLAAARL